MRLTAEDETLKRLTWELNLTWLGGKEILKKIKLIDYDVLHKRPKLNFFDKIKLLTKSKFLR